MSASLELYIGHESTIHETDSESLKFDLPIPLQCPYCSTNDERVGTWGYYPTSKGEICRYKCKVCNRTFNPAKLPFFKDYITEFIYRLAQLTIKDQLTVNSLSKDYSVAETTLRRLNTEIKTFLSDKFEQAKQLYERTVTEKEKQNRDLRVIFYDEGFLKISGQTGFLIFTLNGDGKPITLAVEPTRDSETIYNHFYQAVTQLG